MYKPVEISKEEYLALGDAGAWVWADWLPVVAYEDLVESSGDYADGWDFHKSYGYSYFYTRVPDDVQP